jgi:hypothetical protein
MPCAALAIDFRILTHLEGIGFSVFVLIVNSAVFIPEFKDIEIVIRIFGVEIIRFAYGASHGGTSFNGLMSPSGHPHRNTY